MNSNENFVNLLKLVDDQSREIQKIVRKQLLANALELILNKRQYKSDLRKNNRKQLDNLLTNYHLILVRSALERLLNTTLEDIDLEKTILVISFWSDPQVDCQRIQEELDRISQSIIATIPKTGHPLAFLDHISHYLFRELNIRGNTADYYNPENSYLHKLLETKKGIPITISILYILISRRLEFPVYGVPMPGHFILKFYDEEDEIFFDPFYEGKIYSRQMCFNYLKRVDVDNAEQILNGCANYEIVVRVLKNLHLVYSSYQHDLQKIQQIESFLEMFENHYVGQF